MIKEIKDIKANESFRLKDGNKTFEFTAIDDAFEGMHKSEYIVPVVKYGLEHTLIDPYQSKAVAGYLNVTNQNVVIFDFNRLLF